MTGFGHVTKSLAEMDIAVDLRTLNSRYFDFRSRLGRELSASEGDLKQEIQRRLSRGRVDLYIEVTPKAGDQLELNEALVKNYLRLADELRREGVKGEISLQDLLSLPGVCMSKKDGINAERLNAAVQEALKGAVDQVLFARRSEGEALKAELEKRLSRLVMQVDSIVAHKERIGKYYQEKLSARLGEMLQQHELDQTRLAQEVFYYVEKSEISEEVVRLRSHFDRFSECLLESEREPVGKMLDFLCQEMNREINTILSKTALADISRIAIEAKAEIEKIREQVQNVE